MKPAWEQVAGGKFSFGTYLDENQQTRPEYQLTKTECLYVAAKFDDEARAKLITKQEKLKNNRPLFQILIKS